MTDKLPPEIEERIADVGVSLRGAKDNNARVEILRALVWPLLDEVERAKEMSRGSYRMYEEACVERDRLAEENEELRERRSETVAMVAQLAEENESLRGSLSGKTEEAAGAWEEVERLRYLANNLPQDTQHWRERAEAAEDENARMKKHLLERHKCDNFDDFKDPD